MLLSLFYLPSALPEKYFTNQQKKYTKQVLFQVYFIN